MRRTFASKVALVLAMLLAFAAPSVAGEPGAGRSLPVIGQNPGKLTGKVQAGNTIIYHKVGDKDWSINLTNACPNCCVFCVRDRQVGWNRDSSGQLVNLYLKRDPSYAELKSAVLGKLADPSGKVDLIKFCGYGEPALKLREILLLSRLIKRQTRTTNPGVKLMINTTGWPLLTNYPNRDVMKMLKRAGLDVLSVSLDAPNAELYGKWVKPEIDPHEAFELAKKSIRLAKEAGLEVRITAVDFGPFTKYPELRRQFEELSLSLGVEKPLIRGFEKE
jgi:TatD family-associated radical SAM protein